MMERDIDTTKSTSSYVHFYQWRQTGMVDVSGTMPGDHYGIEVSQTEGGSVLIHAGYFDTPEGNEFYRKQGASKGWSSIKPDDLDELITVLQYFSQRIKEINNE